MNLSQVLSKSIDNAFLKHLILISLYDFLFKINGSWAHKDLLELQKGLRRCVGAQRTPSGLCAD